ncbi:MAG: T9SS type A sorting domain-containing protein [Bacteroidetes bacterium]|nr:MAG: T9SS type A sorting domain-containing protein [Bacteroidota bacterium]
MLRTILILAILFFHSQVQGQNIVNVSTLPLYPGPQDHVKLLIDLSFNSGNCELFLETHSITNDSIQIDVYHCPGPLAYICTVTDTIDLGVFAQGSYSTTIRVHENNYFSPDPCAGGHVSDSGEYQLVVYPISDVSEYSNPSNLVFYSRDSQSLVLRGNTETMKSIEIFDAQGKQVLAQEINSRGKINIPELANGVYMFRLLMKSGSLSTGKLSVQK